MNYDDLLLFTSRRENTFFKTRHIRMDFILSEVFYRYGRKLNHRCIEYVGNKNMTHEHNFFNLTSINLFLSLFYTILTKRKIISSFNLVKPEMEL